MAEQARHTAFCSRHSPLLIRLPRFLCAELLLSDLPLPHRFTLTVFTRTHKGFDPVALPDRQWQPM